MQKRQFDACFQHFCSNKDLAEPFRVAFRDYLYRQQQEIEALADAAEAFELLESKFELLVKVLPFVTIVFPLPWGPFPFDIPTEKFNADLMGRVIEAAPDVARAIYDTFKEHGVDLLELHSSPDAEDAEQPLDPADDETFRRLMGTIEPPDINFEGLT